jgi:hypothetical protein
LLQALDGSDIERAESSLIDESRDAQTVANLKPRQSVEESGVESGAFAGLGVQVPLDDEMLLDRGDLGAGIAGTKGHLAVDGRPTAVGGDLPVALDRLLQAGNGGFAHERHVHAVTGAQPLIEIRAPFLTPVLLLLSDWAAVGKRAVRIERIERTRVGLPGDEREREQHNKHRTAENG